MVKKRYQYHNIYFIIIVAVYYCNNLNYSMLSRL